MKGRRIILHVLFWLVQYGISLYIELYTSPSFSSNPSLEIALQTALAILIILFIKMGVTYYLLYSLIPRWIKTPTNKRLYLKSLFAILFTTLLMRLAMRFVIWTAIFGEAAPQLSGLQLTGRYFYSLLDLMQVLGPAAAIKLFKLRIGALRNEKLLVQEKLRSEILHLKSQVNPHFLFNTLNSIYSLSRAQSSLAPDAVMRLSKILRYMLYEAGEKTIFLNEELRIIEDYIELQQLRFSKRLNVEISKETSHASAQITPLLLLPLVENAFKHGSNEGGTIKISLSLNRDLLNFEISNAVTSNTFKIKGEEGIGLSNIRRQLQLLYRDFSLETTAKENIFKVKLKIDLASYAGFELFNSGR